MRTPLPPIHEDLQVLQQQLKSERHLGNRQRVHALVLIASGQASSRREVANLLHVHRNTVAAWMTTYAEGGLAALLDVYVSPGRAPALTSSQVTQLQQRLADPQGFESSTAIQTWIETTFGVTMSYKAVHDLVHYKLGATPKIPRPSHQKKR